MHPTLFKFASLCLVGIVGSTTAAAVDQAAAAQATANLENVAKAKSTAPKVEPKSRIKPAATLPAAPSQPPETTDSRPNQKGKRAANSTPEPIEPFIKADVIALGQWLVTKSVKNLVATPAPAATPTAAKKPTTASQTTSNRNQATTPTTPKAKPAAPSPQTKRQAGNRQASGSQPSSNQTTSSNQTSRQLPVPRVAALPPEPSNSPTIDGHTEMRVALTKQASQVIVATSQNGVMASLDGSVVQESIGGVGYQISADASGLFVNGQPVPTALWLETNSGYVAVGDRWYRGRLLLLWQDGGVMAVNYVKLQDYLYSVVGAEMSASWSLEALKAQAVAARSYAIVHTVRHQRRNYDLDDTTRYQAYKGIATEASSTQQAVHDTAGEFISYGGGVVESLYAANQDIVDDAHSGYGMSQTGALQLAEQGYRYYEILSAYYPDTSVGRIDVGE